jgi:zinc D-Ala-D-Ala carboxypeptidase
MSITDHSPRFSRAELQCKHTGRCEMEQSFLDRLEALRAEYGKPIYLSSAFRDASHPAEAKKDKVGYHGLGRAVDLLVGYDGYRLLELAIKHGFKGLGCSFRGPVESRFLHVDDRDIPAVWSY